jgi:putative flippase GtrA
LCTSHPKHVLNVHEFIRYGVASLVALVVDVGLLAALVSWAHVYYLLAALLSFVAGIIVTYVLSIAWVFKHRSFTGSRSKELMVFVAIGVVGLLFNELILWICTSFFGIHYLVSKGFSVIVVFLWNFTARKVTLF